MNFLLKHYEKIILAALLTVFICLLAFQLLLWKQSAQIQVDKQRGWKPPSPNYVAQVPSEKFETKRNLERPNIFPVWEKNDSRLKSERNASLEKPIKVCDFMVPYDISICPECKRFLPLSAFPPRDSSIQNKCPLCEKILPVPLTKKPGKLDTDNDGIPDADEERLKMNPKNKDDANQDWDRDGFTNLEEFICGTDINDQKSHPPYYEKMAVENIGRPVLPFILKNVTYTGPKGKRVVDEITIEFQIRRRKGAMKRNSKIFKLHDQFKSSSDFEIVDVKTIVTKSALGIDQETPTVLIKKLNDKKQEILKMEINKPVRENHQRITIICPNPAYLSESRLMQELYLNSKFTIGDFRTGEEKYEVLSCDEKAQTVLLQYTKDNISEKVTVMKKSILSEKIAKNKANVSAADTKAPDKKAKRKF